MAKGAARIVVEDVEKSLRQDEVEAYKSGQRFADPDALLLGNRLAEARAEVADFKEERAKVMAEACAGDEKHCTCVPALRAEIERLGGQLAKLTLAVRGANNVLDTYGLANKGSALHDRVFVTCQKLEMEVERLKAERQAVKEFVRAADGLQHIVDHVGRTFPIDIRGVRDKYQGAREALPPELRGDDEHD